MNNIFEKVKELLHTTKLQSQWIKLAKLYIAILETENKSLKEKLHVR